jgi:hypothetical protein
MALQFHRRVFYVGLIAVQRSVAYLLFSVLAGATSLSAQDRRADPSASAAAAPEAIQSRLQDSSPYERRKALDELMAVPSSDLQTVEVLIQLFRSPASEDRRHADFMRQVGQSLQTLAARTAWTARQVELLTKTLVHNDAYDASTTDLIAATVAGVARNQAFSDPAIDDLRTVLWQRVDKNPQRMRSDNTRSHAMQALRHLRARQGLPPAVIGASVAALGAETNSDVRRETVLLIDEIALAQPASEAMVRALIDVLRSDPTASVRSLAARSLRVISEQRGHPKAMLEVLLQALASDADPAVRREALAAVIAATSALSLSPEALPAQNSHLLLQAASADPSADLRLRAWQALAKTYGARAPDAAALERLLDRLREDKDPKVRASVALTLKQIHARHGLREAVINALIPLITDDPQADVRLAIRRLIVEPPPGRDLAAWLRSTVGLRMSRDEATSAIALPDPPTPDQRVEAAELRTRLQQQYARTLSEDRPRGVRDEILRGYFELSLIEPLSHLAVEVLGRSLGSDADAGLRLQAAAVLLHHGLRHGREAGLLVKALDDGDGRVHSYAAFAMVELAGGDGDVLPGLLRHAQDRSAHRNLRLYCLQRLGQWNGAARRLPDSAQVLLLALTTEPDPEIRKDAWNVLRQFRLGAPHWRQAAADDGLEIQRMAWRELEARGIAKPIWAKWRDPRQRMELIATGLVLATVAALVVGAVAFTWRLLRWWRASRLQGRRMLAAQSLWLLAALSTLVVDGGLLFLVAVSHAGFSMKDAMTLNLILGVMIGLYVAFGWLAWKLLPASSAAGRAAP